jgi:hypothetical protein
MPARRVHRATPRRAREQQRHPALATSATLAGATLSANAVRPLGWGDARRALRGVSRAPVAYAELPGAFHAFDLFASRRGRAAADSLGWARGSWRARG